VSLAGKCPDSGRAQEVPEDFVRFWTVPDGSRLFQTASPWIKGMWNPPIMKNYRLREPGRQSLLKAGSKIGFRPGKAKAGTKLGASVQLPHVYITIQFECWRGGQIEVSASR
jgi:hypothetical protein